MILLQPRFPYQKGGNHISFLKIIKDGESSLVLKVLNERKRKSEAIAICNVGISKNGSLMFITTPDDEGHEEFCRLLCRNGIKGNYREWLKAVDEGDEDRAENNKSLAVISFECDPIDKEEAAKWIAEV
jgi:hypothetical protein